MSGGLEASEAIQAFLPVVHVLQCHVGRRGGAPNSSLALIAQELLNWWSHLPARTSWASGGDMVVGAKTALLGAPPSFCFCFVCVFVLID